MKTIARLGLVLVSYAILISISFAQDHAPPIRVMVLGTFHFTGGGNDEVNREVDDFLSETRQAQIAEVLDRLETFAPDKIMLELDTERGPEFNEAYAAYLAGEFDLGVNERQQLGMRLARRLGHDRLYAVDYSSFLDYRPALAAAEKLGQTHLLDRRSSMLEELGAGIEDSASLTVLEELIQLNRPRERDSAFFLNIAQMGTIDDPGALQVLTWWERNLVIFARTAQFAEPGDKVLLIIGSGHLHLLRQFFDEAWETELVEPLDYLE